MEKNSEILLAQFWEDLLAQVGEDYELYDEWGKFRETENEEQQKAVLKYVRADEYDIYESAFAISDVNIKRKDYVYQLDTMAYQWDFYYKLQIFYYAHQSAKITPKWLHDKKLISNGRYTEWKGPFMESIFSELFDVKRKKFKIMGMEELLSNPKTGALVLNRYLCREDDDEENEWIWPIVRKVVEADSDFQLTEKEKDKIAVKLLGKHMYEHLHEYMYQPVDPDHISDQKNGKPEKKKKERLIDRKLLKRKLNDICKNCEIIKEIEMPEEENKEERQIKFPEYLAAIVAAICEYHETNPFFVKTNIWKKKINVKVRSGIGNDDADCVRLSKYYTVLETYCDYMEELDQIRKQQDFLKKYELFCYQLIYKILDCRNPNKKENKYLQYYIVEQIIGMSLFEVETDIICENLSGEWNMEEFKRNHRELRDILGKIFSVRGVITKIKLAQNVLKEYFANYQKPTDMNREERKMNSKILRMKIEYTELLFMFRERIYVEDILGDYDEMPIGDIQKSMSPEKIICGGRVESGKNFEEGISKYFREYDDKANKINDLKGKKENMLRPMQLNGLAEKEMALDEKRNMIKKWVVCNSFTRKIWHQFEFVSKEK